MTRVMNPDERRAAHSRWQAAQDKFDQAVEATHRTQDIIRAAVVFSFFLAVGFIISLILS
jgi:hypothetical protein